MGADAAVILIKERRMAEAFERAGATSPDRAVLPSDLSVGAHGVGWRRLRERAVVRESSPGSGLFYLDVEVWQALRRTRRRLIVVAIVVALATWGIFIWRGAVASR